MTQEDRNIIKKHYELLTPLMFIEAKKHGPIKWVYPYGIIDWMGEFSPIEKITWEVIRIFGHCPLYPQYPAEGYFLDFANPIVKIAIECDGKDFHLDKEKDKYRDQELFDAGWKIYRIPGSDCVRPIPDDFYYRSTKMQGEQLNSLFKKYYSTIEGLVKSLAVTYFGYTTFIEGEIYHIVENLNERISLKGKISHEVKTTKIYDYNEMVKSIFTELLC